MKLTSPILFLHHAHFIATPGLLLGASIFQCGDTRAGGRAGSHTEIGLDGLAARKVAIGLGAVDTPGFAEMLANDGRKETEGLGGGHTKES